MQILLYIFSTPLSPNISIHAIIIIIAITYYVYLNITDRSRSLRRLLRLPHANNTMKTGRTLAHMISRVCVLCVFIYYYIFICISIPTREK